MRESLILKIQNHIFNMNCVRYVMKVESKDGKFYLGVFTDIKDKEFYFEYPSAQKRNEDWERIEKDLGSTSVINTEPKKS